MPELCRFYNIVIKMIYSDDSQHHKPHFHVYFAEYEASVGVDGELLAGSLPVKQLSWFKHGRQSMRMSSMPHGTTQSETFRLVRLSRFGKEDSICLSKTELHTQGKKLPQ